MNNISVINVLAPSLHIRACFSAGCVQMRMRAYDYVIVQQACKLV